MKNEWHNEIKNSKNEKNKREGEEDSLENLPFLQPWLLEFLTAILIPVLCVQECLWHY